MESKEFYDFLNIILNDYIPKSKTKHFLELINDYGYKAKELRKVIVSTTNKRGEIPIEILEERLKTKCKKPDHLSLDLNVTKKDEVIALCDNLHKTITYNKNKNKIYFYHFGKNLKLLKEHLNLKRKEFIHEISNRYDMKERTIDRYIHFYKLCEEFPDLIDCDLGYFKILDNILAIKKIYSRQRL